MSERFPFEVYPFPFRCPGIDGVYEQEHDTAWFSRHRRRERVRGWRGGGGGGVEEGGGAGGIKYIENFTAKNGKFSDKKNPLFFIFLLKT